MADSLDLNTTGTSAGEQDDSEAVTMVDVLKDEEDLEDDANAVLGAADDKNCTYDQGYLTRQAVYACVTCCVPGSPGFKPAGICLACSYHCHEGHELIELYTKRNFRCDCGGKVMESECKLRRDKQLNTDNRYNQNYSGVYCTCHRPYPDPEDSTVDEMIQCVVCEDWYHGRHLGLPAGAPKDGSYGEMICEGCVETSPFLSRYRDISLTKVKKGDESQTVDVESGLGDATATDSTATDSTATDSTATDSTATSGTIANTSDESADTEVSATAENSRKQPEIVCSVKDKKEVLGTMFLAEGWREQLCSCPACTKLYQADNLTFLPELTDTVHHYERQGKAMKRQFDQGMEALSQMERTQQVEAIHHYNGMKESLMGYLAKFAQSGKVVKEEDIKQFFQEIKSKKRKLDLPPPSNCK